MAKHFAEELSSKDFQEKVSKEKGRVVVDFFAPWCGPCQIMGPDVEKVAKKYHDQIKIYKINIEKTPDIASKYSILSIPTLIFFKGGKPIDQAGFLEKDQLSKKIDEFLK